MCLTVQDALLDELLRLGSVRDLLVQLVLRVSLAPCSVACHSRQSSTSPTRPAFPRGRLREHLVSALILPYGVYIVSHPVRFLFLRGSSTPDSPFRIPFSFKSPAVALSLNNFSSLARSVGLCGSRSLLWSTPAVVAPPGAGITVGAMACACWCTCPARPPAALTPCEPSDLTVSVALAAACELYAWLARLEVVLTAWEATLAAVLAADEAAALAWSRNPAGVSGWTGASEDTHTLC